MYLEQFLVEGDPAGRGCSAAVVRVWSNPSQTDLKPVELCGDSLSNSSKEILSADNVLRFSFFGAQKSVGATGFSAVWTEIALPLDSSTNIPIPSTNLSLTSGGICPENVGFKHHKVPATGSGEIVDVQPPQFQCRINKFCISSQLRCNGNANCGFGDDSDEANCVKQVKLNIVDLVGGFTGLALLAVFSLGVLAISLLVLITWYRRIVAPKTVQDSPDKDNGNSCPHLMYNLHYPPPAQGPNGGVGHFSDPISGLVLPFEGSFSPQRGSEQDSDELSPPSQHRLMNLSIAGSGKAVNGEAARMLLDDDPGLRGQSPSTDDTPIPPPPPPPGSNSHLAQSRSNHSSLEHSLVNATIGPEPSIMMMMNVAGSSQSIDRQFSSFRPAPSSSAFAVPTPGGGPPPLSTFAMFHTLPHHFNSSGTPQEPPMTHQFGPDSTATPHFATLQRYGSGKGHFQKTSSIDNYHTLGHVTGDEHLVGGDLLEDDDAELSLRLGGTASTSSGISHHLNYKLSTPNGPLVGLGPGPSSQFMRHSNGNTMPLSHQHHHHHHSINNHLFNHHSNDNGTGSSNEDNGIDGQLSMLTRQFHTSGLENQSLTMDE